MTPNLWNNTYTLFLFDRQLIYCKKDLLKRTNYIYKGRIFLDNCRILNLPDGKMFGITLKNALRIYCDTRNKWLDFCFRSSNSKLRFLNMLSTERQFCGQSLFVSELAGGEDDLTDKAFNDNFKSIEYIESPFSSSSPDDNSLCVSERGIDVENLNETNAMNRSPKAKKLNKSETLPKNSRKLSKNQLAGSNGGYDFQTNSLGRRRLGNWFRKTKTSNSMPPSPTHQQSVVTSSVSSDSSSQSISAAGIQSANKPKFKESNGTTSWGQESTLL